MPVPTQSLDSIFSPKPENGSITTSDTATANSRQPLEDIFGASTSVQSSKPSLDSIFNPKPPAPIAPESPAVSTVKTLINPLGTMEDIAAKGPVGQYVSGVGSRIWDTLKGIHESSQQSEADTASKMLPANSLENAETDIALAGKEAVHGTATALAATGDILNDFVPKWLTDTVQNGDKNPIIRGVSDFIKNIAPDQVKNISDMLVDPNNPVNALIKDVSDKAVANPEISQSLSDATNLLLFALGTKTPEGLESVKENTSGIIDTIKPVLDNTIDTTKQGASVIKEALKPTITPEEATGHVIQGKTGDIPAAQRVLSSPEINDGTIKTSKELSSKLESQIKPLAEQVDTELAKDPTARPISTFEKTIGEGANATKINYVQEAISNLKELYTNTSDAKGLADIKAIEAKIDGLRGKNGQIIENAKGLTNKEVNDISRLYNSEFGSKAFSKVSGDPLTSVNAQKFENIRMGLKDTARQGLGGAEAKALDAKLSDIYDTKALVDKQVERVNTASQKTTKQGVIPKAVGTAIKAIDTVTGNPLKAIGKAMGNNTLSTGLSPLELEANLSKYLKVIIGK